MATEAQKRAKRRWYEKNKDRADTYAARWADANPDKRRQVARDSARRRRAAKVDLASRNRAWLRAIKMERGCEFVRPDGSVCGWREHYAGLEFSHRDPQVKKFGLAAGSGGRPWVELAAEVAKCDVLCANHHRVLTVTKGHYTIRRDGETPSVDDAQLSLFDDGQAA